MSAIFKREFKAYFTSPVGYIIMAVFAFFLGVAFCDAYGRGRAEITAVFSFISTIIIFAIPILTMRLMSEDRRLKVDQALLTAPVGLSGIVMGKFLAALAVFAVPFSLTLIFQLIFALHAAVDWMVFISNLLGVLLFGGALIAIGLFISSLTESQAVAALGSLAISLLLILIDSLASLTTNTVVQTIVGWISFNGRYQAFVTGVVDLSNTIYFLSLIGIFLFLTVRVLEKKRWA